jgi:hypothetical protein
LHYNALLPLPYHAFVLGNPIHPLHLPMRDRYASLSRDMLWWHVNVGKSVAAKAAVRNWCVRRIQRAFTTALKDHGYDSHGRPVAAGPQYRRPLYGGAVITTDKAIVTMPYKDVCNVAYRAVVALQRNISKVAWRDETPDAVQWTGKRPRSSRPQHFSGFT